MKELSGPARASGLEEVRKTSELKMKRDLEITYVDADGNPLVGEPIKLTFHDGIQREVALDGSGTAKVKNVPLGPINAKQPKRKK